MKIDLNVLKQMASKYGVAPIDYIQGAKEALAAGANQKAEAQHELTLTGNDYVWSDEDSAYHNGDQTIYAFPNKVFLWTWHGMGRTLSGTSRFVKWVAGNEEFPGGKANKFMELYPQMTGQVVPPPKKKTPNPPQTAKDRLAPTGEPEVAPTPLSGPVPDRTAVAPPPSEADAIIQQIMSKAGIKPNTKLSKQAPIRMSPDEIIDLYHQAQKMEPAEKAKMMTFIKTLKTHSLHERKKEPVMTKSQLSELVRHIVRGIVNEMVQGRMNEGTIQDPTKEEMIAFLQQQFGHFDAEGGMDDAEVAMYWFAYSYHGGQGSNLYSVLSTSPFRPGPMARGPQPHSMEAEMYSALVQQFGDPSQEQDEEPVQETTTEKGWRVTTVGYPGMGRNSAPKYAVAQDYTTNYLTKNGNWGRPAEAATFWSYEEAQQFATAKLGGEVSEETGTAAVSPVATPFAFKKKNLAEMNTTDGGTTGYNVPGAFARKGGSVKGVAGSAALGYELTPIGKKEMNRTADKLLEGK